MVIPPRFPQFNWIDLGLPSGTLWLDRFVGAPSPTNDGLFYQWGAVNGHARTDGYAFSAENYSELGLDSISADLSEEQDAARAFYGPNAKMPSVEQLRELVENTSLEAMGQRVFKLTSLINGHSILLKGGGSIYNSETHTLGKVRAWCSSYLNEQNAYSLHAEGSSKGVSSQDVRFYGLNVLAVHS